MDFVLQCSSSVIILIHHFLTCQPLWQEAPAALHCPDANITITSVHYNISMNIMGVTKIEVFIILYVVVLFVSLTVTEGIMYATKRKRHKVRAFGLCDKRLPLRFAYTVVTST